MAVRLSQATSKVGRAVWSLPALSSAAGKAVGGTQEAKSQGVKKPGFISPDGRAGRAIGKKAVIRAAFQEKGTEPFAVANGSTK
jgi:hypothetical protein